MINTAPQSKIFESPPCSSAGFRFRHILAVMVSLTMTAPLCGQGKSGKGGGDKGPSYAIVPLDDWGYYTGDESTGEIGAFDISDAGNAVGAVYDPAAERSFGAFWEVDGASSVLTPLTGGYTAYGLNNFNEIIGWSGIIAPDGTPGPGSVVWPSPTAEPIPLPALTAPYGFTYARDINDSGMICGWSRDPEFDNEGNFLGTRDTAVVWSLIYYNDDPLVRGPVPLPALEDGRAWALTECDEHGFANIVGGFAPTAESFPRANAAVKWTVGLLYDGTLHPVEHATVLESGEAEAFAVNNTGATAGQALVGTNPPTPKGRVWANGMEQTLIDPVTKGRNPDLVVHAGFGINDSGIVVGSADYANYTPEWEATVWLSPTVEPILLSDFLPKRNAPFDRLMQARAINASGVIVGKGWNLEFGIGAFLAIPQ